MSGGISLLNCIVIFEYWKKVTLIRWVLHHVIAKETAYFMLFLPSKHLLYHFLKSGQSTKQFIKPPFAECASFYGTNSLPMLDSQLPDVLPLNVNLGRETQGHSTVWYFHYIRVMANNSRAWVIAKGSKIIRM